MVGWHHLLDGHEFEQTVGVGDGQGSLEFCSPWDSKESHTELRQEIADITIPMQIIKLNIVYSSFIF